MLYLYALFFTVICTLTNTAYNVMPDGSISTDTCKDCKNLNQYHKYQ